MTAVSNFVELELKHWNSEIGCVHSLMYFITNTIIIEYGNIERTKKICKNVSGIDDKYN